MQAHIERNVLGQNVKVYLYEDGPQGRTFYWPVEYTEFGWTWYTKHEGPGTLADNIRPAFEMPLQMWDAFVKVMLESKHVRVDALDIIAATLKREQERVDKLLASMLRQVEGRNAASN